MPPDILPNYVVIYTTGSEEEWERVLLLDSTEVDDGAQSPLPSSPPVLELPGHRPDTRSYDDEEPVEEPDPKLLFIREPHLPLVALCGLIASLASSG